MIRIFVIIALILLPIWYFSTQVDNTKIISQANVAECNLRKTNCAATFDDGNSLQFSISPKTIPLLELLDLKVKLSGIKANKIAVKFVGVNMKMPEIPFKLEPINENDYIGKGSLSICLLSRMEWLAKITVDVADKQYVADFPFFTVR